MTAPTRTSRPATGGFDRIRPRTPAADPASTAARDSQGRRALFSATEGRRDLPGAGSVTVDCERCGARTVLSPVAAMRAAFPSLLLSVAVGHGERESTVGVVRRHYGAFLRCPACRRASWVRLSVRV
ncbi:MAG TPA: hypothetical protein VFJ98_01690 [Mycobacteriales bacterium]|nr:hypothetical protein [Mycobacteriales bacterium]